MSTEPVFAEERQHKIISMLKVRNKLLVNELCEIFSVSPATIRNDLNQLERLGLLKRTHGGAISYSKAGFEQTSMQKLRTNADKKQRIAEYAAGLIESGDTIAIDTGTTTYCLAELLTDKTNLTVVTTDIRISNLLEGYPGVTVMLAGGILRKGFSCTTGAITNNVLSSLYADKVFMATNAVNPSGALCTPDIEQAHVKQSLLAMGKQSFLLSDSSKFGAQSFARFGSINDIDTVITDSELDSENLNHIQQQGVNIVMV